MRTLLSIDSDGAWEELARAGPYHAVCTEPRFLGLVLADAEREAFFKSGEVHVSQVLEIARDHFGVTPLRVLEYGCGVGRLAIPFALRATRVVAVDVSERMLDEARKNSDQCGVSNIHYATTVPDQQFDLVHTYTVLQHIAVGRGHELLRGMLGRLTPGGIAAVHFTYGRRAHWLRKAVHRVRCMVPGANALYNLLTLRSPGTPMMQMNHYSIERVLGILQDAGCGPTVVIRSTDHGGHLGLFIFARREQTAWTW